MDTAKRFLYGVMVDAVKAYQKLFLDLRVWGRENIPPGPKIYVANHITSFDPFWLLPVFTEPVHVVSGPGYSSWFNAKVMDAFEQINAMPEHSEEVVRRAVHYIERGEPVAMAPEGDIQEPFRLGRFYPGAAMIYRRTRVPIIPIALAAPKRCMREYPKLGTVVDGRVYRMVLVLRGTYCIHVGAPWMPDLPDGSEARQTIQLTRALKTRISELLDDVRRNRFWL